MMTSKGRLVRVVVGGLLALAAIALAACGDDESSDTTGAGGTGASVDYQAELEKLYKGTFTEPVGDPIKPETGENVWVISVGQDIETSVQATEGMEDAADTLGWDLTVFDGQFDPNRALSGVEQALADNADAIITLYLDCPALKTGLQRAKEQGVPVVAIEGSDCNELQPGDPSLFTYVMEFAGGQSFRDFIQDWGRAMAIYGIARTDGQLNVILTRETDLETTKLEAEGTLEEIAKCADCKVTVVDFVGTEIGPPLQEKIEQALIENPDANAFQAAYDAILTSGGAAAIKASGRLNDILVMGGEGSIPGIQLIRENGGMDSCIGYPTKWEGYAGIDALARILAGENVEDTNSGIGFQACDAEHNLPPEGHGYEPPVDYVNAYYELWGVE